jgi:membrane-bound acyltransferase YfiQ involved in biofilm formation
MRHAPASSMGCNDERDHPFMRRESLDQLTCSASQNSILHTGASAHAIAVAGAIQPKPSSNFVFANNVRFFSMAAVVAQHSFTGFAQAVDFSQSDILFRFLVQLCKFGTIGFFLISGFLMGEGLTQRSSKEYLGRRIHTVLRPWLTWFGIFAVLSLASRRMTGRLANSVTGHHGLEYIAWAHGLLFQTAYWFVPNLMFAICVLLLCRRFLARIWLGLALLLLSLFYGVNLYTQWIPMQGHTEALFGFIFYLWLGSWAARNLNRVTQFIRSIPMPVLLASTALLGLAALGESHALDQMGSLDALNTLRISNQAFSIAVVLTIFKVRRALSPRTLDVRSTTFGVYLSHTVVLTAAINIAKRGPLSAIFVQIGHLGTAAVIPASLCAWITIYGCSLAVTYMIASRPGLCWMVGARQSGSPAPVPAA